jgi:hypothetical protein
MRRIGAGGFPTFLLRGVAPACPLSRVTAATATRRASSGASPPDGRAGGPA